MQLANSFLRFLFLQISQFFLFLHSLRLSLCFSDSLSFSLGMRHLGLCFYKEDWYEDSQTVGQKYKNTKKKKGLSNSVPYGFFKIKVYTCQFLKGSFFLTCQQLVKSFCFYIWYLIRLDYWTVELPTFLFYFRFSGLLLKTIK